MSEALAGLRIVELASEMGAYAGKLLADMGADVIKVEPPQGEMTRHQGPWTRDDEERLYSGNYSMRNRNKRSICLDLTTDSDREVFLSLVETADGLIENMRAGVMDHLGVGWEVCHERNPKLVYAAIRGFGDTRIAPSPYADWPAYDLIAQAMGGVIAATGEDEDHIPKLGHQLETRCLEPWRPSACWQLYGELATPVRANLLTLQWLM